MKTIFLFSFLCISLWMQSFAAGPVNANVSFNSYVSVGWGTWHNVLTCVSGTYGEFYLHPDLDKAWNYYLKVTINNYHKPTKEEIKAYKKNNQWVEYTGTIKYVVDDKYPTLREALMKFNRPLMHNDRNAYDPNWKKPAIRKEVDCRIRFVPKKKGPGTLNIWVDDVCIGLDLNGCLNNNYERKQKRKENIRSFFEGWGLYY